jgi:hypothetical protein
MGSLSSSRTLPVFKAASAGYATDTLEYSRGISRDGLRSDTEAVKKL